MSDAPQPQMPAGLPIARPVDADLTAPEPSRGSAFVQITVVFGLLIVWLNAYFLWLGEWLHQRLADHEIYAHILGNGVLTLLFVSVLLRAYRQHPATLGLGRASPARLIGWGLLGIIPCYVANIVSVATYLSLSGADLLDVADEKVGAMDALSPIRPGWVVPVAVFVGVYEEVLFRGFLLSRLRILLRAGSRGFNARAGAAIVLSAAVFGIAHGYQGGLGIVQTFAVGLVLCAWATWRGEIWSCIVAHVGIDVIGLFALQYIKPMMDEVLRAASKTA